MSNNDRKSEASVHVAKVSVSDSHSVASPSRRRIIKVGASAVPVLATLTSQSALAATGVCSSTSAWGSALINPSSSQVAHTFPVASSWRISAWNSSAQGSGTPWFVFKNIYVGNPNTLTFAQLSTILVTVYPSYYWNPSTLGFAPSELVMGHLTNDNKGYFLVAQLNYAVGVKPSTDCVTDDNWRKIVANEYPTIANPWILSQIGTYIQNNFIVQA